MYPVAKYRDGLALPSLEDELTSSPRQETLMISGASELRRGLGFRESRVRSSIEN